MPPSNYCPVLAILTVFISVNDIKTDIKHFENLPRKWLMLNVMTVNVMVRTMHDFDVENVFWQFGVYYINNVNIFATNSKLYFREIVFWILKCNQQ